MRHQKTEDSALFKILKVMNNNKPISNIELTEKTGVSPHTVRRILAELQTIKKVEHLHLYRLKKEET